MKHQILKNIPWGTIGIAILLGFGISQNPLNNCPQWVLPIYILLATFGIIIGLLHNLDTKREKLP